MLPDRIATLERLYAVTHIPLSLLDAGGEILATFPSLNRQAVSLFCKKLVLEDFRLQKRGPDRPLISYIEPGFFLGILELPEKLFLLVGLVTPLPRERNETLKMIVAVTAPEHLQQLCSLILQTPLVPLDELQALICLLSQLLLGRELPRENILFIDAFPQEPQAVQPEMQIFQQRENTFQHESVDWEAAVCNAVEQGSASQLTRSLCAPRTGQIGRMSLNDLQQDKYAFVALATLASRAAIRGGLTAELAFSLSDLYCQRADALTNPAKIGQLAMKMLADYCKRVRQKKKQPVASPVIQRCLEYVSAHLHEPISLSELSRVCGLCTRSLSLNFKAEMGMSIRDYLHEEKLKEAEYLLRYTDYTLSQISAYLNYSSQSYFTRIFRETRGITPQQYRAKFP